MDDLKESAKPKTWYDMQETLIENSVQLPKEASEDAKRAELRSQSMYLTRAFIEEGIRQAQQQGYAPGSEEAWRLLERSHAIAEGLCTSGTLTRLPIVHEQRARVPAAECQKIFSITYPWSVPSLVDLSRKGKKLEIDKGAFEGAVSDYLRSGFKFPLADRLILTTLLDMEITAYLAVIYEKNILTRQSVASVMDRAPIATWLIGRFWAVIRLIVVGAAAIGMLHMQWIGDETTLWVLAAAAGLFVLGTVLSFISYLSFRQRWTAQRPKLVDLPMAMLSLYGEVHSDGPLSVRRMREQIQKVADMGAVWPGAVWALLDDLEARGVASIN